MPYSSLHTVPIFLGLLLPANFVITYILAVVHGHVPSDFPYISDAGATPPESCIFGQLLNISGAIMVLLVYIRHKQLLGQPPPYRPSLCLLRASLWTGWTSALGVSMVGNFQLTNMPIVHYIGAFLAFAVGILFFWIQVLCTRFDPPERFSSRFIRIRWGLAATASFFFVFTIVGSGVAFIIMGGSPTEENYYGPGHIWYVIGTGSEWATAICMCLYIMTFKREFQNISLTTPQVLQETKTTASDL